MKLPKLFRKFTPILLIAITTILVLAIFLGGDSSSLLSKLLWLLFNVTTVVFVVTVIGLVVFRPIANGLLRRFGESATATVVAVAGTNERVNRVGVYRVKLRVFPGNGDMFEGVAEDAIRFWQMPSAGDTVPVKFDPRTKEVALDFPPKEKTKEADF